MIDVAITAVVALAISIAIAARQETGAKEPDVYGYLLGVLVAAPLLVRRRWPLTALFATAAVLMTYHAFEYPAIGLAMPLAVALYTAAVNGKFLPALALATGLEALAFAYREVVKGQSFVGIVGSQIIVEASLMAAVLLLGVAVHNRRAWMNEVQERLRRTEMDRDRETERRVREERLRIAREMHDVLGHSIAVIGVQAGVAAEALQESPEQARAALRAIREKTGEAMADVRAALGALREAGEETPVSPVSGLAHVDALVAAVATEELPVELSVAGPSRTLPTVVDLAAYRIVQESLTNVLRHAGASRARVAIRYAPDSVVVEIDDDGVRRADGDIAGQGLAGMKERAAAVGGCLEAGPAEPPDRGFRVRAWLPTDKAAA